MTEFNYKALQNGSDIRGIALSGIKDEAQNLLPHDAGRLAKGFLLWLSKKTGKLPVKLKISIGYDPRLSGKPLQRGIIDEIGPYGVTIFTCGLSSTPAMFMSTIFPEYDCDGAIMITASHLPYNRNGFKYFDKNGGLNKSDISQIIDYAENDSQLETLGEKITADSFKRILGKLAYPSIDIPLMDTYSEYLRQLIIDGVGNEQPLKGLKITVDAGNGGGGFYAYKVLAPLGADISSGQFLEPDGTFPNHAPNPEDKQAMHSICMAVLNKGADLGLIFDTDVDRSAAVDSRGREISRNGIVAMAAALVAEEHPGTTIVTDSITSDQLNIFLEQKLGLKHLRFKRGYKNVINESIRLNKEGIDSQLAIETSGHAAFKENYFLDDGAYLATKIVIKAARLMADGKTVDCMIADLEEAKEAKEVRLPILDSNFSAYGDQLLADMITWVNLGDLPQYPNTGMALVEPNYEGVRISFDKEYGDGWCLLRKSLHDPIMPLNLESNTDGGIQRMTERLLYFLKSYNLDLTPLEKLI